MSDRYEERIDAALSVLREAQAPQRMEDRLLAAMRTREVAAASTQNAGPAAGWFSGRGGLVWSGMAAAVVLLVGLLAASRREVPATRHSVAAGAARPGQVVGSDASDVAEMKHEADRKAPSAAPVMRVQKARSSVPATHETAYSDANLPSFPAPPAPLTEEERLLLKIVRSGDRMELAMLDPAIRNARVEDEKAEVRKFFGEVTETVEPIDKGEKQ